MARISKAADQTALIEGGEEDLWAFGSDRRDVGSLHIDQITCRASDLARRNLLAVHPVAGWWKAKKLLQDGLPTVRFALIIEIDAENVEVDLYTEVQTSVAAMAAAQVIET